MSEEERRRKIIIDSGVAALAARGIVLAMLDKLTAEQARAWTELDREYLERLCVICPEVASEAEFYMREK